MLLRRALLPDGVHADVRVGGPLIREVAIELAAEPGEEVHDLDGALLLPALVEPHAHLDKAFLAERIDNPTGDLIGRDRGAPCQPPPDHARRHGRARRASRGAARAQRHHGDPHARRRHHGQRADVGGGPAHGARAARAPRRHPDRGPARLPRHRCRRRRSAGAAARGARRGRRSGRRVPPPRGRRHRRHRTVPGARRGLRHRPRPAHRRDARRHASSASSTSPTR